MKVLLSLSLLFSMIFTEAYARRPLLDRKTALSTAGVALSSYVAGTGTVAGILLIGSVTGAAMISSMGNAFKEAVVADSQEYSLSGKLSIPLYQSVKEIQAEHPEISEQEAVDLIVESVTMASDEN